MIKVDERAISEYIKEISAIYESGHAVEQTYRPAFIIFITKLGLQAYNETTVLKCGHPDVPMKNDGLYIGYVEFKDVNSDLDKDEGGEQITRYLSALHNFVFSDYLEFRWYQNGIRQKSVRIAIVKNDKIVADKSKFPEFIEIMETFLNQTPERINNPYELSVTMARIARSIRDSVKELYKNEENMDELDNIRNTLLSSPPRLKNWMTWLRSPRMLLNSRTCMHRRLFTASSWLRGTMLVLSRLAVKAPFLIYQRVIRSLGLSLNRS